MPPSFAHLCKWLVGGAPPWGVTASTAVKMGAGTETVKVVVRCRPLSKKEEEDKKAKAEEERKKAEEERIEKEAEEKARAEAAKKAEEEAAAKNKDIREY